MCASPRGARTRPPAWPEWAHRGGALLRCTRLARARRARVTSRPRNDARVRPPVSAAYNGVPDRSPARYTERTHCVGSRCGACSQARTSTARLSIKATARSRSARPVTTATTCALLSLFEQLSMLRTMRATSSRIAQRARRARQRRLAYDRLAPSGAAASVARSVPEAAREHGAAEVFDRGRPRLHRSIRVQLEQRPAAITQRGFWSDAGDVIAASRNRSTASVERSVRQAAREHCARCCATCYQSPRGLETVRTHIDASRVSPHASLRRARAASATRPIGWMISSASATYVPA
jgi:hypothetical protein